MLAGQVFRAAEKGEVHVFEGIRIDGLNEGNLVAHLVQLALGIFLVEEDKAGRRQGRLRQRFLQLLAQQG
jgi:hypothetical protein